jgi:hypothetical protein
MEHELRAASGVVVEQELLPVVMAYGAGTAIELKLIGTVWKFQNVACSTLLVFSTTLPKLKPGVNVVGITPEPLNDVVRVCDPDAALSVTVKTLAGAGPRLVGVKVT